MIATRKPLGALIVAAASASVLSSPAWAAGPAVTYSISSGTAGTNGWYVSDVTAAIAVSGATDTTCPAVKTFHAGSDSLDCSATDGTSTVNFHLQFKIDKDKPVVTGASADRGPNGNGWYASPVTVTFTGTDATSGIASCTQSVYSGPDSGSAVVSGTCVDAAGNVSSASSFGLKYDSTPPTVSASATRPPDANGWYNQPVTVAFAGSDSASGIDACTTATYGGPDSTGATVSGTCTDRAGNSAGTTFSLQYDSTPPTISASLDRRPDANGWYNHAVRLAATETDATSGAGTCTGGTYAGPDSTVASLTATCADKAGNEASQVVPLKYDDTPPKLKLTVTTGNGTATLHWAASPALASVTVTRSPGPTGKGSATVYRGAASSFADARLRNGVRYRYRLSGSDEAGNVVKADVVAVPLALTHPLQGAKVTRPPLLRWTAVSGADYYNVQIFFGGHKVMSAWPVGTKLELGRAWRFSGKKHTLVPGRYRWYVWPGFGPRKAAKYGKLLGGSAFVVTRPRTSTTKSAPPA